MTTPTISYNRQRRRRQRDQRSVNFTLPGHTYGPYNVFGPYRTGNNCNIGDNFKNVIAPCYRPSPRSSMLTVANVSADYDLDFATAHLTTAYIFDRNKGANDGSFGETSGYQSGVPFLYTQGLFQGYAVYKNQRTGWTDELRFASKETKPYSWVLGFYDSYQRTHADSHDYVNEADYAPLREGVPDTVLYGAPVAANGDITNPRPGPEGEGARRVRRGQLLHHRQVQDHRRRASVAPPPSATTPPWPAPSSAIRCRPPPTAA